MVSIKEMSQISFPVPTLEEWKEKGEAMLKGKSVDSLVTETYEGITLKPLYTKEDQNLENISQYPGQTDYRRGIAPVGNEWEVAQQIKADNAEELKEMLVRAFDR